MICVTFYIQAIRASWVKCSITGLDRCADSHRVFSSQILIFSIFVKWCKYTNCVRN